jgi:DNA ligase D-like protein (predicted polymerase)
VVSPKRSIRTKLIVSYVTLTVLSLAVLGVLFSRLLSDYLFTQQERVLITRGQAVAKIVKDVAQGRPLHYQARVVLENMGEFLGAQVWLVDRSGLIIAASKGSVEWEGIQLDADEFNDVMKGTVVTRRARTGRFNMPMITVAVPVTMGNQVLGALFMNTPVSAVEQTLAHVRRLVLTASVFAFLISNLVGIGLSRSITRPLRAMTSMAQEMTKGVFDRRVPIETKDEVGELGQAINLLAEKLERSLGDLQEERDKFQSIVTGIDEGVIAADNENQLLWINPQAGELLRVGHIPLEKLKMDDLPVPLLDLLHRVSVTGQVEALDVSPYPLVVLRAYGSPIRRGDERVGSVILLQDVSEARRLENMRRDFLANITHEPSKTINYILVQNRATLIWLANQACIELHPWLSLYSRPQYPDWLVFDLDPAEGTDFDDAREIAFLVKKALDELGLVSYPKLSGATGIHIYVPIEPRYTYKTTSSFVGSVGKILETVYPSKVTTERLVKHRTGRVYVDHLQNLQGKTLAAPYSPRPLPEAPVSTPVTWQELENVYPHQFHLGSILGRLQKTPDLFAPVLGPGQSLDGALADIGLVVT